MILPVASLKSEKKHARVLAVCGCCDAEPPWSAGVPTYKLLVSRNSSEAVLTSVGRIVRTTIFSAITAAYGRLQFDRCRLTMLTSWYTKKIK
jgi:hypothetical protein